MNRKVTNPQCWTSSAVAKQQRLMNKWKKIRIVKTLMVVLAILSFVSILGWSMVESGKWEWDVNGGDFSTTQEGEEVDIEGLLGFINSSAISELMDWVENVNTTVDFNATNMEELSALLNDTLGEGATFEDFLNAVESDSLEQSVITEIVTTWVDGIISQFPESWYDPLELIGTYRGSTPIDNLEYSLFMLINSTEVPLVFDSVGNVQTDNEVTISISIGYILESIINETKSLLVDELVSILLNNTEGSFEVDFFNGFVENVLPKLPLGIGFKMNYESMGFPSVIEVSLDFGKYLIGGEE